MPCELTEKQGLPVAAVQAFLADCIQDGTRCSPWWWFPHRQLVAIRYKTQTPSPLAPAPSWAQGVGAAGLGGVCLPDVTSQLYQSQVAAVSRGAETEGAGLPGPTRYTGHLVGSGPQWGLGLLSRVDTLLAACRP